MSLSASTLSAVSGAPFKVAIVAASYNERLVEGLIVRVKDGLLAQGVKAKKLSIYRVPGSNELPYAVQAVARKVKPDVIIALGVIIRGDTIHYELIADAVTQALQTVALEGGLPVINGVIAVENDAQATARCIGPVNRGAEFARAALAMAELRRTLTR